MWEMFVWLLENRKRYSPPTSIWSKTSSLTFRSRDRKWESRGLATLLADRLIHLLLEDVELQSTNRISRQHFFAETLTPLVCQSLATSGSICPKHETWSLSSPLRLVCRNEVYASMNDANEPISANWFSSRWLRISTKRLRLLMSIKSVSVDQL